MVKKTNREFNSDKKRPTHRENKSLRRHIKKHGFFFSSLFFFFHFIFFNASIFQAQVVERIAAIVNDHAITQTEIDEFKRRIKSGVFVDDFLFLYEKNPQNLLKNEKKLFRFLILEKIMDLKSKENNIVVSKFSVDREIENLLLRRGLTKKELKSFLNQKGFQLSEYRNFIEKSMRRFELIRREVSSNIKISPEEVTSYYRKHRAEKKATHIFIYTLSHIFIPKSFKNSEISSKEKALLLYKTLKKDEKLKKVSFERIAFQYSEKNFPLSGGFIGSFSLEEMNSLFRKVVSQLEVGEFSKPINTSEGYYILKLDKKNLASHPELEKEKQEIRNILINKKFRQMLDLWLEEQEKRTFIHRNTLAQNFKESFKKKSTPTPPLESKKSSRPLKNSSKKNKEK